MRSLVAIALFGLTAVAATGCDDKSAAVAVPDPAPTGTPQVTPSDATTISVAPPPTVNDVETVPYGGLASINIDYSRPKDQTTVSLTAAAGYSNGKAFAMTVVIFLPGERAAPIRLQSGEDEFYLSICDDHYGDIHLALDYDGGESKRVTVSASDYDLFQLDAAGTYDILSASNIEWACGSASGEIRPEAIDAIRDYLALFE